MIGGKSMNRLEREKSPYLLQHADNPVDWYPWCEEAFREAAKRDVPIFLSIGYSVCHWCHVMAHESFEDAEAAALINKNYVAVKVDREERPDIDAVYMAFCQAVTGSGGWPLTIIMTPDKKPFFAATYLPKRSQYGHLGLIELLTAVSSKWKQDRTQLLRQSDEIINFLNERTQQGGCDNINPKQLITEALKSFRQSFDPEYGGFGQSPKFPSPHNLLFLMAQKQEAPLSMAEKTLVQMYRGGIFDHIGGGFCRYSTDDKWLVPHFEKMLYDNALLILSYSQAYKETGKTIYRDIAEKTVRYVLRELTDSEGAFYCSQDADSDGVEGKFYLFRPQEVREVLGQKAGAEFCRRYDITEEGNFEGKGIPNLIKNPVYGEMPEEYMLLKLYRYRMQRTPLHRDDKILTSWNGLMIASLAKAARLLDRRDYLSAALNAVDFLWEQLRTGENRLLARFREGEAAFPGTLEDYAYLAWGLIECYRSTFDPSYLQKAVKMSNQIMDLFFDREKGGCYLYANDSEQLFMRPKETYDGALPSGNSVAALVMNALAFLTGEQAWKQAFEKQANFLMGEAEQYPAGHSFFLWQMTEELADHGQLICVCSGSSAFDLQDLWQFEMDILVKTEEDATSIEEIAPFLKNYPIPFSGAEYYLCQGQTCHEPVKSLEELKNLLASLPDNI